MTELQRRQLWVRAGGRCTLCKRYLLDGAVPHVEVCLDETTVLTCADCHREVAAQLAAGAITAAELLRLKAAHERETLSQTGLSVDRRSVIVRAFDSATALSRDEAARAVLTAGDRFPQFPVAFDQQAADLDLRPAPDEAWPAYYARAQAAVQLAFPDDSGPHRSVFVRAPAPVSAYLGWQIGATADVFAEQDGSWQWRASERGVDFSVGRLRRADPAATDAVLLTNLAGTVRLNELPDQFSQNPAFELRPDGTARQPGIIASLADLAAFERAARQFFSDLPDAHEQLERLHVFGPLPTAAAFALGRSVTDYAAVVFYHRGPTGFEPALQLG